MEEKDEKSVEISGGTVYCHNSLLFYVAGNQYS